MELTKSRRKREKSSAEISMRQCKKMAPKEEDAWGHAGIVIGQGGVPHKLLLFFRRNVSITEGYAVVGYGEVVCVIKILIERKKYF